MTSKKTKLTVIDKGLTLIGGLIYSPAFITVGGTREAIKAWRRKMRKKMKNKRF